MNRNTFNRNGYILESLVDLSASDKFDCGKDDLNEYFHQDIKWHKEELVTQTYKLYKESEPELVLALLDFCNDSIRTEKFENPPLINPKIHYHSFPAVKLTRFGVRTELHRSHVGTNAMNLVKMFFLTDNRTGCRFITVDSYLDVVGFYKYNGFNLFSDKDRNKERRAMWFDLLPLKTTLDSKIHISK
jgi:hypothetical protein